MNAVMVHPECDTDWEKREFARLPASSFAPVGSKTDLFEHSARGKISRVESITYRTASERGF
jgi:hypothetical protein